MTKEYGWLFHCPVDSGQEGSPDRPEVFHEPYPRFSSESISGKVQDRLYLLDGVLMNWIYDPGEDRLLTWASRLKANPSAFAELEGSFNGFFYDLSRQEGVFFTNQTGERTVYYFSHPQKGLYVASNYNLLSDRLHQDGIPCKLDPLAFRSMVVFGGMHDDRTWIQGVHRLMPGKALHVTKNGMEVRTFHVFDSSHPDPTPTLSEWIEQVDASFRAALSMDLEKSFQHGKISLIDISGGLDSRMNVFLAREMGYSNVVLLSYSAMGSNEQKIAQEVARETGYPLLFSSIDDGGYLCDLDELVRLNYGTSYYAGITGGKRLLSFLSEQMFGMEITGLLGEMSNGGYSEELSQTSYLLNKNIRPGEDHEKAKSDYPNSEMFYFHTRGPLWGLGSMITRRNFAENYSPFMHTDFLELSHRIPEALRRHDHVFLEWMKRYYPKAAQIPYAKDMVPPAAPDWKKTLHRKVLFRLPGLRRRFLQRMAPDRLKADPRSMNPLDYYYERKEEVRVFVDERMEKAIRLADSYDRLQDISRFFANEPSTIYEKAAFLTAYAACERYIIGVDKE